MEIDYSHGVQYSPSSVQLTDNLTVDNLKDLGISYIRLQWVDLVNNVRYRVIPLAYFQKMLKGPRPGIALTKASLGLVYLSMAEGFTAIGEYLYVPDLSSLRICSYEEGQAVVMGWFQEKAPVPQGPSGTPSLAVDLCPRGILQRVVDNAKNRAGVEFLVGIETEFVLLKSTEPITAGNIHSWSRSEALFAGSEESQVLREIADCLLKAGIELQMYHAEAAPGQYEIVTGPLLPLQAADATVFTRETISNIAAKHGLHATFAPRIFSYSAGSAAHAHISIHPAPSSKILPPKIPLQLSTYESSFLSGVLTHLPAITALTLPIPASYGRVTDGAWSGGTYVCWGTENREAPVRLTNASSPSSRNFECRFLDATANPHLALAAILGAGAKGVELLAKLVEKDVSGEGKTAAQMSEEERREKYGILKRLALSWEEARERFKEDEVMRSVFGANFIEKYLSVNKTLAESLAQDNDEAKALERLVKFY